MQATTSWFSRDACRSIHEGLQAAFHHHGVEIGATPLARDLEDLAWLSNTPREVFAPGGAWDTHPRRTAAAVVKATRYKQLLRALRVCESVPGLAPLLKHLKRLSLRERETQAWDHTFEIEAAAMLHGVPWRIELDVTDIVLVDGAGLRIGCECKRPRSISAVGRVIRDACEQLKARERAGVVLISLDRVIDEIVVERLHGPVTEVCRDRLARVAQVVDSRAWGEILRLSEPNDQTGASIMGVMLCTTSVIMGKAANVDGNYLNTRFESHSIPNPYTPLCEGSMELLRTIMQRGQARLRERTAEQ